MKTIAHVRHAGRHKKGVWLIIGECSYCSKPMWGWLSRFKMMGCTFFSRGDFDDQLFPITSAMDEFDYDKVAKSDSLHGLCNGVCIDRAEYRRGTGQEHFKSQQQLYGRSWTLESCIDAAKKRVPRTERTPQYRLELAHRQRIRLNATIPVR